MVWVRRLATELDGATPGAVLVVGAMVFGRGAAGNWQEWRDGALPASEDYLGPNPLPGGRLKLGLIQRELRHNDPPRHELSLSVPTMSSDATLGFSQTCLQSLARLGVVTLARPVNSQLPEFRGGWCRQPDASNTPEPATTKSGDR